MSDQNEETTRYRAKRSLGKIVIINHDDIQLLELSEAEASQLYDDIKSIAMTPRLTPNEVALAEKLVDAGMTEIEADFWVTDTVHRAVQRAMA